MSQSGVVSQLRVRMSQSGCESVKGESELSHKAVKGVSELSHE